MQYIVFTDSHIQEDSLAELDRVFQEILSYSKGTPILVCVGDYYEKKNPSAREINFGTEWAVKFKKHFKDFIMVAGNHPDVDGITSGVSYLKHLGINVVEDIILDNTYYGHFMVKESSCGFNETTEGSELASVYRLSILGHQHSFQDISFNSGGTIVHPGSIRYVDFGEAQDKGKYILLVENGSYAQIRLNKVRPMFEIDSVAKLVPIPKEAQVCIVYKDFNQFLTDADALEKYKTEFHKFKVKFDFDSTPQAVNVNISSSAKDIVEKWLESIENVEVRAEIEKEFKNSGIC